MKNFIISFLNIFLLSITPALCQENPDEYRDCAIYTMDEAMQNTAPDNNILIFTYSDKTTRAFHTNIDCAIPATVDETSSSNGNNSNPPPQEDDTGTSNSGGSNSGGSSSGSSNSGGSSSGGSNCGSSSSGGSSRPSVPTHGGGSND